MGWHALLTKYERRNWDGTAMWWEERRKTPWNGLDDCRGQRTPQSRTTEGAMMGRHDTTRHEVSPNKERTCWRTKEVEKKHPSGRPLPWEGLIQAGRRYSYIIAITLLKLRCHNYIYWSYIMAVLVLYTLCNGVVVNELDCQSKGGESGAPSAHPSARHCMCIS